LRPHGKSRNVWARGTNKRGRRFKTVNGGQATATKEKRGGSSSPPKKKKKTAVFSPKGGCAVAQSVLGGGTYQG